MMGRHHAMAGAALWLLATVPAHGAADPLWLAASTATAGASGMLPDLDEPGSTVAHLCTPISEAVSRLTGRLAGGHRQATHSILGLGAVTASAWALSHDRLSAAIAFGLLVALAFRGLAPIGLRHGTLVTGISALAGWAAWSGHFAVTFLPWAVLAGYASHLAGDVLTSGGVPLLWPWHRDLSLPILGNTGSWRESLLALALALTALSVTLSAAGLHQGPRL